MQIDKKTLRNIFLGIAGCIFLIWMLWNPGGIFSIIKRFGRMILPFAIGAILAFIMNVPMRVFEKMLKFIRKDGLRRAAAIVLTLIALSIVLALVVLLLVPQLIDTIKLLASILPGFVTRVTEWVTNFLYEHPELLEMITRYTNFENVDWSGILKSVFSMLSGYMTNVAGSMYDVMSGIFTTIFNLVVSVVFSFYCLFRKEILARQARRVGYSFLPEKVCDEVVRIARMVNRSFAHFISGQCLEAVILGCLFAIFMAIFRMPFIPLVSVIISLTSLIPIVGAIIGCCIGAFFIFVQNPMQAVWFIVMFLAIQQIETNLIYPRVMGTSVGLPGMWVLFAVGIGSDLMGIPGMMVMIPLATVAYELAREITNKRLKDRGIAWEKLQYYPPDITSKFIEKRQSRRDKRKNQKEADSAEAQQPQEPAK